jgi:MarR family
VSHSHILAAIERARNDDLDRLSAVVTQDWANSLLTDQEAESLYEGIRRRRWALKKPRPTHAALRVVQTAAKGHETSQPKVRRNYRRKDAFEDQVLGDGGLSRTEVRVAWTLVREFYWDKGSVRETLTQRPIARKLGINQSSVSRAVNRLVRRGHFLCQKGKPDEPDLLIPIIKADGKPITEPRRDGLRDTSRAHQPDAIRCITNPLLPPEERKREFDKGRTPGLATDAA